MTRANIAHTRQDNNREPLGAQPIEAQISWHRARIAFLRAEIARDNWQLGRDPDRTRQRFRKAIEAHEYDIDVLKQRAGLTVPVLVAAE